LIKLNQFSEYLRLSDQRFFEQLKVFIENVSRVDGVSLLLDKRSSKRKALFMFDGLDEVPIAYQPTMTNQLKGFATELVAKGCKIILTTRTKPFQQIQNGDWQTVRLVDLTTSRLRSTCPTFLRIEVLICKC